MMLPSGFGSQLATGAVDVAGSLVQEMWPVFGVVVGVLVLGLIVAIVRRGAD